MWKEGGTMMSLGFRSFLLSLFEDKLRSQFPVYAVSVSWVLFPDVESLSVAPIDSENSASVRDLYSRGGVGAFGFDRIPKAAW
jgi:hypothetical protein